MVPTIQNDLLQLKQLICKQVEGESRLKIIDIV